MSKRRLCVTLLVFVLVIALVIGSSYLVSLALKKNDNGKTTVNSPSNPGCFIVVTNQGIK